LFFKNRSLVVLLFVLTLQSWPAIADSVLRTSLLLDGTGKVLINKDIHIRDGRIHQITDWGSSFDFDLRGQTVTPGWIDTHTHIAARTDSAGQHVMPNSLGDETLAEAALATAANAYATLMAGFTTIRSPGDLLDVPVAQSINKGGLPGPRILTSRELLFAGDITSDTDIIKFVHRMKREGADVLKVFGDNHGTITAKHLAIACGEAKKISLLTMVHADSLATVNNGINANCDSIEHGFQANKTSFVKMADKGIFYSPSLDIPVHYARRLGDIPEAKSYTSVQRELMPPDYMPYVRVFQSAVASDVEIVFASDAVAGVHGSNADEFVWRVIDGGQTPLQAIGNATSTAAKALGLEGEIGRISPGYQADIVAVDGNLLDDIRLVKSVSFIMKGGEVYYHKP